MRLSLLVACALLGAMLAFGADARVRNVTDPDAPRALPAQGNVSVRWTDPAQFSDLRFSGNRVEAGRGNWVEQLAEHLRTRASRRLPAGERLDVEITDVRRAGRYEPWRGVQMQDVRILRDIYPPRIDLQFQRVSASGQVLSSGERTLTDPGYLMGSQPGGSDSLRFEKGLIDRWLRREFAEPRA